jgi:glycine/D-amino acid oxidase-like deaminating enzyme/nitrite reductase/ring-hydroxylating ferredoxin subunit
MEIGKDTSGKNIPAWFNHVNRPEYPTLNQDVTTDVCIVGGGIAGLTTAYCLVCEGKSVVLIDDGRIVSGETGRTTAHLTNILDDRYYKIEKMHGEEVARLAAQSHAAAIRFIEITCQKEKIDCEFMRVYGYLFLDETTTLDELKKEVEVTRQLGLSPQLLTSPPQNTFNMEASILFPDQAQFHPMKYLEQLAKIIVAKGGKIFENTHAKKFEKGKPAKIMTNTGATITANNLVVATNVPVNDRTIIHTKQEARRTYVLSSLIPKASLHSALYWDTATPYHYVRVHSGEYEIDGKACDLLITGGEDHRVGSPPKSYEDCFNRVETWTKKFFPQVIKIVGRWSGQIIEPVDYLAFIGHNPMDEDNCFIATGDSGNGLTHGTIAGILISDLILDKNNEWEKIYKPSRKSAKAWKNFLKNNVKNFLTYFKYFTPGDISDVEKIKPGEGAVIRKGIKKIAAYRDSNGVLHECSAICPHLQSIVCWNSSEKTWDCPAHGSRYTGEGKVINGPSNYSLHKIKKSSE